MPTEEDEKTTIIKLSDIYVKKSELNEIINDIHSIIFGTGE